ncbi:hypothetical protein V494_01791 [Pseudogymnoascus sp. VKM F-4513 (FW-928)]|nr:hypothetical protein V494_01791 [Pseudogymnoascus sp. VKM F-4513 (FW-928)]
MSEVAPTTSLLADSFERCSDSFKELYLALFAYGPISLSKFNDEYGRFGVWGGDAGADRTGRGSLDDVLRNDPKTASIIAELLKNLNDDLITCISLARACTDPHKAQSHDGQDWLSDEESSASSRSDDSNFGAGSRVPSQTQRILHLLAIIVDHIQSLFQVSTLLRRPTISNKYIRSGKTTAKTESPFYLWDLAHIIEKRRFWINQQKQDMPPEKSEAEDIQHQKMAYLWKRLAAANVKRRDQLEFWQEHPDYPSKIKLPGEPIYKPVATTSYPILTQQRFKKDGQRSQISKPSQGTKMSFSTVAKSDLNDNATFSGRPLTEYVPSTKGGKYVLRVPPVPKTIGESSTLICPYCSIILDRNSMLQRQLWKSDMERHLLEKHAGQVPKSQVTIMVDICERPMDDDEGADCPICLATLPISALRTHLATHLEELALFVLPYHTEDQSEDVGSDKVEGATGQRLINNASDSEDGLPPLDSEKSLPVASNSQHPETFATLLQSMMEFEHKDIEGWVLTNDQMEQRDDGDSTSVAESKNTIAEARLWQEFQVASSKEFKIGYVFKVVWNEPGRNEPGVKRTRSSRTFISSELAYNAIRRFVILKSRPGYSLCCPISTYGGHGTSYPGVKYADHAIIFTESKSAIPPLTISQPPSEAEGERPLPNPPICVELISQRHHLDVMSRINYAKVYTIEHNTKVCFIGKIHKESIREFFAAYDRIQNAKDSVHPDNRAFGY